MTYDSLFTRQTAGRWAYAVEVGERAADALLDETWFGPIAQLVSSYNVQHPLDGDRWTAAALPQHSLLAGKGKWAVWRFARPGHGHGYIRDPDPVSPWFRTKREAERWHGEHMTDLGPITTEQIGHIWWAEDHWRGSACLNCRRRELEPQFTAEPCPKNPQHGHALPLGSLTSLAQPHPLWKHLHNTTKTINTTVDALWEKLNDMATPTTVVATTDAPRFHAPFGRRATVLRKFWRGSEGWYRLRGTDGETFESPDILWTEERPITTADVQAFADAHTDRLTPGDTYDRALREALSTAMHFARIGEHDSVAASLGQAVVRVEPGRGDAVMADGGDNFKARAYAWVAGNRVPDRTGMEHTGNG
jgi:hypothetical protein